MSQDEVSQLRWWTEASSVGGHQDVQEALALQEKRLKGPGFCIA